MRIALMAALVTLSGCSEDPDYSMEDAATDAVADSGLEYRLDDLEQKILDQESEIDALRSHLDDVEMQASEASSTASDAQSELSNHKLLDHY